jgi:hypothetical protein
MRRHNRWMVSTIIAAGLATSGMSSGTVLAAGEGGAPPAKANAPAKLEKIPGSDFNKVVLTPKAAERIAIEMGAVTEEPVHRWLLVAGEVEAMATAPAARTAAAPAAESGATGAIAMIAPAEEAAAASAGGGAAAPVIPVAAPGTPVRVRVPRIDDPGQATAQAVPVLSLQADDDDDDDADDAADETAVILIRTNGNGATPLKAKPVEVGSEADKAQYYELMNGGSHGLKPGQQVQVRVPHPDNGKPQKVIPYSAVIYSPDGKAWVYTSTEPLAFVRHPIEIEYIDGERVILKEGPATGTPVVTVGAAELWGVETKNG